MPHHIESEVLLEILVRCLQLPDKPEEGKWLGLSIRGSGPGASATFLYALQDTPTDLPGYWRDYVGNELMRRDVPGDQIEFRSAKHGSASSTDLERSADLQSLARLFELDRRNDLLAGSYHTIAFSTQPRYETRIFLLSGQIT